MIPPYSFSCYGFIFQILSSNGRDNCVSEFLSLNFQEQTESLRGHFFMNVGSSFVVFSFCSLTATFAQHLFVVTCRILEMALFRKDDIYQEDEEPPPWGKCWENTGGSRVQWAGSQKPRRGRCKISVAVLLSYAYCVTLKNHSGSSKTGMSLHICSEPLRKDSKVEILF